MKKSFLWVVVLVLSITMVTAFSLYGCKAEEEAVEEAEEAAEEEIEEETAQEEVTAEKTEVVLNTSNADPAPKAAETEVVEMFMEKYPNIEVNYSVIGGQERKQLFSNYLTSSTGPDVLSWYGGERNNYFMEQGLIMDISDLWESEGWVTSYPKSFLDLSTRDGKQYVVPVNYYWWAIYYNKEVFEKYNVQIPTTWDEFLSACETFKNNQIAPITLGTKNLWTTGGWFDYINMRLNGPQFHIDLASGKESFTDPRVKEVFIYWKDLIDKDYFIENFSSYNYQESVQPLLQGKAAMMLAGQHVEDTIPEEMKYVIDFFRFPIIDPNIPIGEDAPTDIYFAPANALHPQEAKILLSFLGSKEVQELYCKAVGRVPVNSEVDLSEFPDTVEQGLEIINGADVIAQYWDRDASPELSNVGFEAFTSFMENTDEIDSNLAKIEKARTGEE